MKCEYKDGLKVDYSGDLHITKGSEVNVFMKEDFIASNIKNDLNRAAGSNSCEDLRKVAQVVTDTVGSRVCIHE